MCAQIADPRAAEPLREAHVDKKKRVDRFGHFTVDFKNHRIDLTPRGMDLVLRRLRALPGLHPALLLLMLNACFMQQGACLPHQGTCQGALLAGSSCCSPCWPSVATWVRHGSCLCAGRCCPGLQLGALGQHPQAVRVGMLPYM